MADTQSNGFHKEPQRMVLTKASEWRSARNRGYDIILPSENKATLIPIALDQLIQSGTIPDFLTPLAAKSLWDEEDAKAIGEDPTLSAKFIQLINLIVPLAMLVPRVVENPRDGEEEIAVTDLEFQDKVAIFNLAIQPSSVLKNFCLQQEKSMAELRDSEDDELSS